MPELKLSIAFWACVISANVWAAAGKGDFALPWILFAALAFFVQHVYPRLEGFWSRVRGGGRW